MSLNTIPPLSNLQERVERSIFTAIREVLVQYGFLPDVEFYLNNYGDEIGYIEYTNAKDQIERDRGFCIDLYGYGNTQSKGEKKIPRINIDTVQFLPGGLGNAPNNIFVRGLNQQWDGVRFPPISHEIQVDINIVGNTAEQSRQLHAVLGAALQGRRYLRFYDKPEDHFLIEHLNSQKLETKQNLGKGLIEYIYTYDVMDMFLTECYTALEDISPIREICLFITTDPDPPYDFIDETCIEDDCVTTYVDDTYVDCGYVD